MRLVLAGAPALETFIAKKVVAVTFGADARSRRLALRLACEPAVDAAFIIRQAVMPRGCNEARLCSSRCGAESNCGKREY